MNRTLILHVMAVLICTFFTGINTGHCKDIMQKRVPILGNYTKIRVTDYVNIRFSDECDSLTIRADKKSFNAVNITYIDDELRIEIGNYQSDTRISQPLNRYCEVILPFRRDVTEYYMSGTSTVITDSTLNITALFISNGARFEAPITNRECYIVGTGDSKIHSELNVSTLKLRLNGNIDARIYGKCSVCDIQAIGTTILSSSRKYITADHIHIVTAGAAKVIVEALKAIRGKAYDGSIITCHNNPEELDIKRYDVSQVLLPDVPRIPEIIE